MRILNFQDGFSSSLAPTGGLTSATSLLPFASDALFLAYKTPIAVAQGDIYFNTTDNLVKFYDGTQWNWLSYSGISPASFAILNNQASVTNITGMFVDPTKYRTAYLDYEIYRQTTGAGATELAEAGKLVAVYSTVAGTWELTQGMQVGDAGVTLSITSAGQFQYTSTSITGTANLSYIKFKINTLGV